ncbi:7009_t:CDS:1, partial [Dentiscutata erythropus]
DKVAKGYYSTTCFFCDDHLVITKPNKLKAHLVYVCKKVDSDITIKVLISLTNDCVDSDNDIVSISTTKTNKKCRLKSNIDYDYENIPTLPSKEEQINNILLKMVVCCNLPFALVEHPFFQEYTNALCATYSIPSHWIVSNSLLDQEVA